MTVFNINCDLFSLGEPLVKDNNGEIIEDHPLLKVLNNPNSFQGVNDILWDFMFWDMIGNAYLYVDSKNDIENNSLYFLNNTKIEFPQKMLDDADKLFLSRGNAEQFKNSKLTYTYNNGKKTKIDYRKVVHFADTSLTAKAWFKAPSKLEALYKIVSNSELSLDAKNKELLFNNKYMVAGKVGESDLDNPMLSPEDKKDIEHKVMQDKPITAVKSMVDVKKFVDSLKAEQLDKTFMHDVFNIAKMYNIPKDVIEAEISGGAKYENQEKSRGNHVDYALKPKGEMFLNNLMSYFGFEGKAEMSWEHLPFMHFRTMQKNEAAKTKAEAFRVLVDAGVNPLDAQREVGYEFENEVKYEQVRNTTSTATSGQGTND